MSRIKLLRNLIDDVRAVADAMASDESAAEQPVRETPAEKAICLEDVRAVLAAKSRDGYGAQVRELIAKHGGSGLSDISPSEYWSMLKEAEVFGNAT